MTQQENPLFEGFKPQMVETSGADPFPVDKPAKKRKGRKAKVATRPSDGVGPPVLVEAPAEKKKRKSRTPETEKRPPKFDLQTILKATSGLKDADMPAFQKGLELLLDENKAGRERLLAGWGKVFA